jgi:predicted nucleic-acid-binding Zn-ribbon protein
MTSEQKKCPKCAGNMIQGFVHYSHDIAFVGNWFRGQPKKSFWTGTKGAPHDQGVPTGAFACEKCGFLEFYAGPDFAAQ